MNRFALVGAACERHWVIPKNKPYYKVINDWVHAHTGWKTFYHSCGAVYPLMQDFVDMGVDILKTRCSSPRTAWTP